MRSEARGLASKAVLLPMAVAMLLAACGDDGVGTERPSPLDEELRNTLNVVGIAPLPTFGPQPAARVELGRMLFFDPILSGNRDVSCATCHHPSTGMADGLSLSVGTGGSGLGSGRVPTPSGRFMGRNAQSILNASHNQPRGLFWDGRVARNFDGRFISPAGAALPQGLDDPLAVLAMFPVVMRDEMRGEAGVTVPGAPHNELADFADDDFAGIWGALMRRLLAIPEYVTLFRAAFPNVPTDQLGFQHAANALSSFQIDRLTTNGSPFDQYVRGDLRAISEDTKRGALLFLTGVGCTRCHSGSLFSDGGFVNIGVPPVGPGRGPGAPLDHGREDVTGNPAERFRFRVPSLRNVELTGPWMHNGAFTSLEAVVRHYADARTSLERYDPTQLRADIQAMHHGDPATRQLIVSTLDPRMVPLGISDVQVPQIVAFLRSLTDPAARNLQSLIPDRVPSGLPVAR